MVVGGGDDWSDPLLVASFCVDIVAKVNNVVWYDNNDNRPMI